MVTGYSGDICLCADMYSNQAFDVKYSTTGIAGSNEISFAVDTSGSTQQFCLPMNNFTDGESVSTKGKNYTSDVYYLHFYH